MMRKCAVSLPNCCRSLPNLRHSATGISIGAAIHDTLPFQNNVLYTPLQSGVSSTLQHRNIVRCDETENIRHSTGVFKHNKDSDCTNSSSRRSSSENSGSNSSGSSSSNNIGINSNGSSSSYICPALKACQFVERRKAVGNIIVRRKSCLPSQNRRNTSGGPGAGIFHRHFHAFHLKRLNVSNKVSLRGFYTAVQSAGEGTIFSVSSGHGKCGVAVVRVSGPQVDEVVKGVGGFTARPTPRKAVLRTLVDPVSGDAIDRGLVLCFPGPNSFTGEDCVEFQVHGGPAVVSALLTALYKVPGCRQAEPGEFTKRAFLNGKLDLTEVEGLGDLIHAETEAQRRQALRQMEGDLSQLYSDWRGTIVKCVANIEAYIDFAEDQGIEDGVIEEVTDCVSDMRTTIQQHLDDGRQGERLRVGVHVAIVGEPNVGKSSLLNRICRRPAAIVTEVAGTTRDVIETAVNIGGYPVLLSDTAGIRHTDNIVEREGVHRARARAQLADLKIFMIDLDQCDLTSRNDLDIKSVVARQLINLGVSLASGVNDNLEDSIHECNRNLSHTGNDAGGSSIQWNNTIIVFNKSDLVEKSQVEQLKYQFGKICGKELSGKISSSEGQTMVEGDDKLVTCRRGDVGCHDSARPDTSGEIVMCSISCVTGEGVDTFLDILKAKVADMCGNPLSDHPSLTQARHRSHLTRCVEYLQQYDVMLHDDDIVLASQALRKALREIGKITGKITSEEILDVIFQDFCIGK